MLLPITSMENGLDYVFGENYVQDCCDKMDLVAGGDVKAGGDNGEAGTVLPEGTKFAFIGNLQSNKINKLVKSGRGGRLVRIETIAKVETVEKVRLCHPPRLVLLLSLSMCSFV